MSDIERWSPDIMHFHSVHIPEAILIARRLARRNVPYCVAPHGGLIGGGGRQRLTSRALATALERRYLDRAAFLHAVSRADLQGARRYATRVPIVLAPNGIDPKVMPVELDSDLLLRRYRKFRGLRVLLYVGRLDPEVKGLDLLLQAWSRTGAASGMGLVIVGPDWRGGSRRLRLMAERLHLSGSVAFHGQTSGREKWDLLAGADIFVLPSRREAAPVTVLEAMLAAKPLLLSEAADPGKLIAQAGAGLVVQPTLESMKKGLKAVSELSDERLTDMGVNARRLVNREFGWERPTKMLLDAYEDAISSRTERTKP
jgi:glycosyltransferase involved in cell wall biosynthesis